ncbi:MAG: ATP-binding protein [Myxococcales bacterium]|nr:ATP-binding protein [Myxococcales bacterium]
MKPARSQEGHAGGSLQTKLLRSLSLALLPAGLATVFAVGHLEVSSHGAFVERIEGQLRENLMTKGRSLAGSHILVFQTLVADNAATDMQVLVTRAVEADEDVLYGLFMTPDGQPWAYAAPDYSPPNMHSPPPPGEQVMRALGLTAEDLHATRATMRRPEPFGGGVLEFVEPVLERGELAGTLRYGISLARMRAAVADAHREGEENLRRSLYSTGAIVLVSLLLGGAAIAHRSRRIIEPLAQLRRAAERLSAGDRGVSVDIRSDDELSALGDAFNTMVQDLESSYAKVEASNVRLSHEIDERTRAEQQREELRAHLNQAQKMEALGQLAGGIAHDFNNVLASVMGSAELLQDQLAGRSGNDDVQADLQTIVGAASTGAALTRQLLTFSRKEKAIAKVVDPTAVVGNMAGLLRRVLAENVNLVLDLSPQTPRVYIDPTHFEQVLMNLVVNARDAMGPKGGRLRLSTGSLRVSKPVRVTTGEALCGEYAELTVDDEGCGMDAQTAGRIFEPFFTTKPAGEGTGLGLATVHGIVRQAEGLIDVTSVPGRGTTFRVLLPERAAGQEASSSDGSLSPRGAGEAVLVCEDDDAVRHVACKILERYGYQVLQASSSAGALRMLEALEQPISILLTDVIMPGMNGRELVDAARSRRPNLPVLYMSGYTCGALDAQGLDAGQVELIAKPFSAAELVSRIASILEHARHLKAGTSDPAAHGAKTG